MKSLETHFGSALLRDYDDLPINTPQYERNKAALLASIHNGETDKFAEIECIHGHFLPLKYLLLSVKKDLKFITWMRDPIERILSHFFFWKRYYDPATAPKLHHRMVEEDWTVERFCLSPELQNIYGQFLWGFPLEYLDFIGITEFYDEDLAYFSEVYLNCNLAVHAENVGSKEGGKYQIDEKFRKQIQKFHDYDMTLYKRALVKRQARCSTGTLSLSMVTGPSGKGFIKPVAEQDSLLTEFRKSKAICILGMHRSGTSAIARAINFLGVYLGEERDICNASFDNPEGFWEQPEIRDFHDRVLGDLKERWDTATPLKDGWDEAAGIQPFNNQLLDLVQRLFGDHSLWAWKEPRTCLCLPLWKSVLADLKTELACLFVVRSPLDVAESLRKRNGFSLKKSYGIWFNYNIYALRAIADVPTVFVHYDKFLENWEPELKRCAQGLGIPWPNDDSRLKKAMASFLHPDLRHSFSNASDLQDVPEPVQELYSILLKLADGEATQSDSSRVLDNMYRNFVKYAGLIDPMISEEQMREHDTDTEQRIASLQSQLNELIRQLLQSKKGLVEKDEELAERDKELFAKDEEMMVKNQEVAESDKELLEKKKELIEAEQRIQALLNSYSWRVTAPLRKIYEVLFGVR